MSALGTEAPSTHGAKHWTHRMPERVARGENHYRAKLTWRQVDEMRRLHYLRGMSLRTLAISYGVCKDQVVKIITGRAWKHVRAA